MKVFVAFDGDEVIGVYETLEKARDALREQGFTHYPVGHPDQERLCLWGAKWLKEVGITRRRWVRGYITDEVVR